MTMQINGKIIEWRHLRDLYHKFHSMAVQSAGLLLVPKLKMEHVELTSFFTNAGRLSCPGE